MKFTIAGLDEADQILNKDAHGFTHLISIAGSKRRDRLRPDDRPIMAHTVPTRLDLSFDDYDSRHHMMAFGDADGWLPSIPDVRRIIGFAKDLGDATDVRLLAHCAAGVSRSSAAVLIVLATLRPSEDAALLLREVVERRPIASPNKLMVRIADHILDRREHARSLAQAVEDLQTARRFSPYGNL